MPTAFARGRRQSVEDRPMGVVRVVAGGATSAHQDVAPRACLRTVHAPRPIAVALLVALRADAVSLVEGHLRAVDKVQLIEVVVLMTEYAPGQSGTVRESLVRMKRTKLARCRVGRQMVMAST